MIKIQVTGAADNSIGSAMVGKLLRCPEYHVISVDNFLAGDGSKLPSQTLPNFTFIKANINREEEGDMTRRKPDNTKMRSACIVTTYPHGRRTSKNFGKRMAQPLHVC